MRQMEKSIPTSRPAVVGVIHTMGGFSEAGIAGLDAVELRVDALPDLPSRTQLTELPVGAIATVRRSDEGGVRGMSEEERVASYLALLPFVAAIDLEMRSVERMADLIEAVRRAGKLVILSCHDFAATPPLAQLQEMCARMRELGADIVKVATKTETPGEVARLLGLLEGSPGPLALMGMGTLGRASRLLFAKAGSALNYGWLDTPQVPGQWSAREFIEMLARA